jgi:hypothetical protein
LDQAGRGINSLTGLMWCLRIMVPFRGLAKAVEGYRSPKRSA